MAGKMKRLQMREVSGVDYPAHLANGFHITKAAGRGEGRMAENGDVVEKSVTDATPDELAEVAKAFTPEQVVALARALNLKDEQAVKADVDEAVAKATKPAEEKPKEDEVAKAIEGSPALKDLMKSLTAKVEKAEQRAADAEKTAQVEKAARLDAAEVEKSKATYTHLAIDHEKVAPAIRKMRDSDPDTANLIEGVLKSVNGQAESGVLFKELGTPGGAAEADSAYGKITTIAKALVKDGKANSMADGVAKALDENPNLYADYVKEGAR